MGETVVINIEANTKGLQTTIDQLTKLGVIEKKIAEEFKAANDKSVKSLEESSKKVVGSFEKVSEAVKSIKVDNDTAKNLDLSTPVIKTATAAKTLRQQYREAVLEAQRLADAFGENSVEAIRAQKAAAGLKDSIEDLNQRIQTLNPDAKFRAISNLGNSLQGIFYTATGSLQAFGIESEKLDQVARGFSGILGALSGLDQLTDAKDNVKNLAAVLGISKKAFVDNAQAVKDTGSVLLKSGEEIKDYKSTVTDLSKSWVDYKNNVEVLSKVKKGDIALTLEQNVANKETIAQNILNAETKVAQTTTQQALNKSKEEEIALNLASAESNALETESTIAATVAKEGEIVATNQATNAQTRFNIAAYANPYVLIAAAIVAAVGALVYFATKTDDAVEAQEKLEKQIRDTSISAREGIEKELVEIDLLVKKYQEKQTTDAERLKISKKLNEIAPETIGWFNKEGKAIVDLNDKTNKLIETKIKQAEVDAYIQELGRLNTENLKIQNQTTEESISGFDKFLAGTKALFQGQGLVPAGIYYELNKASAATENNNQKLAQNNKLIEEYKKKINELGDALISTDTTIEPKDPKEAFNKALDRSKDYFDKLRIQAANKAKDDEEYAKLSETIAILELEAKLNIFKKYKENTTELELELAEQNLKIRQKFFESELKDLQKSQQERENIARNNAASEEEFADGSTARKYVELQEQLKLYEKYGEDVTEIQKQIDEILLSKRKSPAQQDKQDFENAIALIDQYYNSLELNILQTSKTREEADNKIAKNEIEKLEEQIKAGEKFGQNVDELRKKLAELKFADVIEQKKNDIENQIKDLVKSAALDQITKAIADNFQSQIDAINEIKEQQLENIDEEEKALQESYERRAISKRELEAQQKKFAQDRLDAERNAEIEIAKIKQKQAIADKAAKIFEIAINTAKNAIEQPGPLGALVPYWIALGAAQAAVVAATPVPKYKKGTLSVPGYGEEDSVHALLQPGEAVIPTQTNRKYATAIKAIYEKRISADDINNFVRYKLEGGNRIASESGSISTKFETSDLYALGRIIKKNDTVYVKNLKDLAYMLQRNNRR